VGKNCGKIKERFCGRSLGKEELWKNCRKILRALDRQRAREELWKNRQGAKSFYNSSTILPRLSRSQNLSTICPQFFPAARARKMFLQFFHNSSSFGASGLAWGRIVEGKIVEELWT
jgi:hypothetical protein